MHVNAQAVITVLDAEMGTPVVGAHVVSSEGTTAGTTDANGSFTVPSEAFVNIDEVQFKISHIGYTAMTRTVHADDKITLKLRLSLNQLQEFVVTGQYRPEDPRRSVHRIRVVGQDRLQATAAVNLADALTNETNIRIAQDNVLGSSISMQGLSGQNVKILIDGVPVVGRLDGNIDLSQLDISGVKRIEVIDGPLAVNYGTDALAGTINLITRDTSSSKKNSVRANIYTEHIGRVNLNAGGEVSKGKSDLALNVGRNFFAGWDPNGPETPTWSAEPADARRFQQWKPREQIFGRVNYGIDLGRTTFGYKGEAMHDRIVSRGLPRAPYELSAFDEQYTTLRLDNALFATHDLGPGLHLNIIAAHNRYQRVRNTWLRDLTTLEGQLMDEDGMQDTTQFQLSNARVTLASAKDSSRVRWEIGTDLNHEVGRGARIGEGNEETIGDYAGYASAEYEVSNAFTLRPGLRYSYNTKYDAPLVPSFNIRWKLAQKYTLRASFAQGFRAPSIKELHFQFVDVNHDIVGNEDLLAERSNNYGLSVLRASSKGGVQVEFNSFFNDINDLITLAQVQGTSYTYINIGTYRTAGGQLSLLTEMNDLTWRIGGGITGRYDDVNSMNSGQYSFTPEGRASITWKPNDGPWRTTVLYQYQGELSAYTQVSDVEIERSTIGAYHLLDANVARRFWQGRLDLTLGCKDLLNTQNIQLTGPAGGVHSGGGESSPLTTGRTFFLRLSLQLQGS